MTNLFNLFSDETFKTDLVIQGLDDKVSPNPKNFALPSAAKFN